MSAMPARIIVSPHAPQAGHAVDGGRGEHGKEKRIADDEEAAGEEAGTEDNSDRCAARGRGGYTEREGACKRVSEDTLHDRPGDRKPESCHDREEDAVQPPAPDDPDGVGLDHPVREVDRTGEEPGEDRDVGVSDREAGRPDRHGDPGERYEYHDEARDEERPLLGEPRVFLFAGLGHHAGYTNVPCLPGS